MKARIAIAGIVLLCAVFLAFQKISSPSSVGTSAQILHGGSSPAFGALNLSSDSLSGALPAANGPPIPIFAFCSGTVGTGNATSYVLQPAIGTGTGAGCNQLTSNEVEPSLGVACTIKNLRVAAGAAGAVAGSGLVRFRKNGAFAGGQPNCTLGTGTSCTDLSSTVSMVATDTWSIEVITGQASDTTAGVKAVVQCQ